MKRSILYIISFLIMATLWLGCNSNDGVTTDPPKYNVPSAEEFSELIKKTVVNHTQKLSFNIDNANGLVTLKSQNGVNIIIDPTCLTLENGDPVKGIVDVEFIEMFDPGTMAVTNVATYGTDVDGKKKMLKTGGEFKVRIMSSDKELKTSCSYSLLVPASLTGDLDTDMQLFKAEEGSDEDVNWVQKSDEDNFLKPNNASDEYGIVLNDYNWTNIDRFYDYTGPKTTILVKPPSGFNGSNCRIFFAMNKSESNGLARLDRYDSNTGYFSEHYGEIPIGKDFHLIFMSEDNGAFQYIIQSFNIVANQKIELSSTDIVKGTADQLKKAINNLP